MKTTLLKISDSSVYRTLAKEPLTYVAGATLLAVLQIVHFTTLKSGWGIVGPMANWGAWMLGAVGIDISSWSFFSTPTAQKTLEGGLLNDGPSLRNLGVIVGACLAALLASQFKIKPIKHGRQIVAAVLGGLLMGYGARIANGCNVGALFTGTISMSLSGWVFLLGLSAGAFVGGKLLVKFFM